MRSENRHYNKVWKDKPKDHFGAKCRVAKCPVCHCNKVWGIKKRCVKKQDEKDKNEF